MADRPTITLPNKTPSAPATKDDGEDVTYCPGNGDPPSCKWRGIEFKANVPVRLTEKDRPGMIEAARGNRFFRVGSEKRDNAPIGEPTTAMEYRAWVVDWIKDCGTVDQLVAHWAADRELRTKCEVGHDDISFLGTLVEPKLKQMRLAEGLSEADVAGIWIKHGVLDLPWRS